MNDSRKELLEVATFESEFEAKIFMDLLADKGIEALVWDIDTEEKLLSSIAWVKVRVWNDDWELARILYEKKYPDKAEKTIIIDGKTYVSIQDKQCKHCMSSSIYIPEPPPLKILLNLLLSVFLLGSPKAYYCERCKRHSRF